ncbi:MAG: hypothetical protein SWY16_04550 [Cyanobacteriota bacterium]|nr:hypothetical protein [Cyanobacteriota bacterium]
MAFTRANLQQFYGSETFYRNPLFGKYRYTEGVKYIGDNGASWLVTDILAFQGEPDIQAYAKQEHFQAWTLTVNDDESATLVCEDGNNRVIFAHDYTYVDFPLSRIKLYLCNTVLLLPSEY